MTEARMRGSTFAASNQYPMRIHTMIFSAVLIIGCAQPAEEAAESSAGPATPDSLVHPSEKHFKSLRQLSNGGDIAEAYWSFDGTKLVFQATVPDWGDACDQIFVFNPFEEDLLNGPPRRISMAGRTTCSYFMPGDTTVLFASTHLHDAGCPKVPERRSDGKYLWPIYDSFDIYEADLEGTIIRKLTDTPGYDAEATLSPKGDLIVFTSMRDGDLELYTMKIDGSDVRRVTNLPGYDGGAFFSPDGTQLVWRASRPGTPEELAEYNELLQEGLVMPTNMELYIANVDGTDMRKITDLGQANWAPYWHPSGNKIIFASNHKSERGFPFTLYLINTDGTGLEQVSYGDSFDAFPVFSRDGKHLVFSSNRNNREGSRDTNLFIAEWQD